MMSITYDRSFSIKLRSGSDNLVSEISFAIKERVFDLVLNDQA